MTLLELSDEIDAPIWRVYHHWRSFSLVTGHLPSITTVRHLNLDRLAWEEEQSGQCYEVDYRVTARPAENVIIWNSLTETQYTCTAHFQPRSAGRTLLELKIHYRPDDGWQQPNAVFQRHMKYLATFKRLLKGQSAPLPNEIRITAPEAAKLVKIPLIV